MPLANKTDWVAIRGLVADALTCLERASNEIQIRKLEGVTWMTGALGTARAAVKFVREIANEMVEASPAAFPKPDPLRPPESPPSGGRQLGETCAFCHPGNCSCRRPN
jgi:hypothetical protein